MNLESHKRAIEERLRAIDRAVIDGLERNQRNLGFNVSVVVIDMLEVYLHREGHLSLSASLNHEWFSSVRRANEHVVWDFQRKEKIIGLIVRMEEKRNILVYGRPQVRKDLEAYLELFNEIKEAFHDLGVLDE